MSSKRNYQETVHDSATIIKQTNYHNAIGMKNWFISNRYLKQPEKPHCKLMRPGGTKDQFQFTERSFAVCNTYKCHRQHYFQSNSKNVRTSVCDNFKLHDLKPAFRILKSRKFITAWFDNECVATPLGLPKNILQCTRSRLIVQCWWKTKKISINILIAKGGLEPLQPPPAAPLTDMTWINHSQLPSLNFLSADLTWLDMYIWVSLLNRCLHSGETRYNLKKWCFWLINILILLNKSNHKCLQMSVLNRIRSENFQKKTFQNNSWLVSEHELWIWSWVELKHPWQAAAVIKW